MGHIVLERAFGSPLTAAELISIAQACDDCAELYRVSWLESFLSQDGKKALCIFDTPDAEAVRQLAGDASVVSLGAWPGRQRDAGSNLVPNMVVVRTLDEGTAVEGFDGIVRDVARCFEQYQTTLLRTYFLLDQRRMTCVVNAPDVTLVRPPRQQAGMPFESVWACRLWQP